MPDTPEQKPPGDDMFTAGRPDAPQLADVVEFAREPFGEGEATAPRPAPTPPPPVAPKPDAPKAATDPVKPAPPRPQAPQGQPQSAPQKSAPQQPAPQQPAPQQPAPQQPAPQQPAPPRPQPQPAQTPPVAAVTAPPVTPEPQPQPQPARARPAAAAAPAPSAWRDPAPGQFQLGAYLRANARRVVWLVVVPILVAELALGLFALGPQEYKSTATVNIPTEGSSVSDVTQSVSEYRSLVTSDAVARQVSAQTNVRAGRIQDGLSTRRNGTSSLVDVTYTSSKKTEVLPVTRAVSREALAALIEPEVEVADRALKKAEEDFAKVQQEIIEFNASHGLLLDPPETYRAKVAELGRLRLQAQQAKAPGGNAQRAASLDAAVAQAQREVESLAVIVRDYQRLQTRHDQLQSTINSSANRLSDARARIDAANASSTVDVGGVKKVNALAKTARAAAITFVVGLLLMVGLLVLLEVLGYGAGGRYPAAAPAAADDRPAPTPKRRSGRNTPKKRRR